MKRICCILKISILNWLLSFLPESMSRYVCKFMKISVDSTALFAQKIYFEDYRSVRVGRDGHINKFTRFYTGRGHGNSVNIGNNVYIGMETTIITTTHEIGSSEQRCGENIVRPILIEDGAWIGAKSVILPGVTIGKGCIIQAGSVVYKDCKPNCIYGGNPAKMIGVLSQ